MKFTLAVALTAATAASAAVAQPHAHQHRHQHKRAMTTMYSGTTTVDVFELNGTPIPVAEVCSGIASGSLMWEGSPPPDVCSSSSASTSPTSTYTPPSSSAPPSSSTPAWTSSAAPSSSAGGQFFAKPSSSPAASSWGPASSSSSSGSGLSGGSGVTSSFPDGQLSCSTFPSQYGAVNIDYMGLGGWIGIQSPGSASGGFSNIVTATSGGCTEGSYCSYACPPGYQKSQWPSTQGATGQSVGGILCQGGMLHLTNSGLSSNLCIPGTGNVQATNNAGSVVSICRTDYPGTESETVPVELQSGETQPLTCPDCSTYYKWQGSSTSAQYYLNPPGTAASTGCQWGSPGGETGNYAPINFGVGACSGTTWLSIIPNKPTTDATYPGTVEIQGNLSGSCKYENGQFCSASGCGSSGCTVSIALAPSSTPC